MPVAYGRLHSVICPYKELPLCQLAISFFYCGSLMEVRRALEQVSLSRRLQPEKALQLVLRPISKVSPGQVVVRMIISIINPVDITVIKETRFSSFSRAIPVLSAEINK
ncbi:hypothetical protein KP509_13G002800 [Ceratopteris richardii]|uniref:Uncharacterized protein n=1 Tax=Ceratopteris richardii TaxID=49495 RepID=A0A8T2TG69_CERRI|nr:hypothetical protein KP509_13G002800 [Ceratopteris richardii]